MLIFGVLVSAIWLFGLGLIIYLKMDEFLFLQLNALGDFLAGGFAPLAFLWLVIGYFQQGKELSLNREALLLQASELRNSVEQQKELVAATREEIEHIKFESEKTQRDAKRVAQPFFKLTSLSLEGESLWLVITNYGCEVRNLSVSVYSQDNKVSINREKSFEQWEIWGCDKKISVILKVSKVEDVGFFSSKSYEVVFKYLDGLGELTTKRFNLESGGVEADELVEV